MCERASWHAGERADANNVGLLGERGRARHLWLCDTQSFEELRMLDWQLNNLTGRHPMTIRHMQRHKHSTRARAHTRARMCHTHDRHSRPDSCATNLFHLLDLLVEAAHHFVGGVRNLLHAHE